MKGVRIELYIPGQGHFAYESEDCPLNTGFSICRITVSECRFALTETEPPIGCPMKTGAIKARVMRIEEESEDT